MTIKTRQRHSGKCFFLSGIQFFQALTGCRFKPGMTIVSERDSTQRLYIHDYLYIDRLEDGSEDRAVTDGIFNYV
jgi:hypothetical protein